MSDLDAFSDQGSTACPTVREVQLVTHCPSEVGDENFESGEDEEDNPHPTKKRKCTSKVWEDFAEVTLANGTVKAECIHCSRRLSFDKTGCTTHLDKHLKKCLKEMVEEEKESLNLTVSQSKSIASLEHFEYDHVRIREILSHMIIVNELPFHFPEDELFNLLMGSVTPHYQRISGVTTKKDCLASFESEKDNLMAELNNVNRLSVSTDLWKSDENVSYVVVSCHYVDSSWKLQRRILNFCEVPPPHSGLVLCDVLHKCLVEWEIEKKVWTVTVDNAAHNDVAIGILRKNLSHNNNLPLNGKFFHVRCYADTLKLLVQDGLSAIKDVIFKVCESVKYVVASAMRINMFGEIAKQLELSSKKLVLDRGTSCNATYFMLSAALDLKDVFSKYQQRDTSYTLLPSEEEWKKVRVVCSLLEGFIESTNLTPGIEFPTSKIFLNGFFYFKKILSKTNVGEDTCITDMVTKMKAKLDKYFGDFHSLMCVAVALDPRYKMEFIDWYFQKYFSSAEAVEYTKTVHETLHLLYNEYVEADEANKAKTPKSSSNVGGSKEYSCRFIAEYQEYLKTQLRKSELEVYLDHISYIDKRTEFDALSWWRMNNSHFRILSKMACDVLSIPITTVALQSAFLAGSKVIDPHHTSLGVDTMRVLLCGGDWLRARYGIMRKDKEKEDIQEINLL